jgi:hypothetical protein
MIAKALLLGDVGDGGDNWRITYDCGHTIESARYGGAPRKGDTESCPVCEPPQGVEPVRPARIFTRG